MNYGLGYTIYSLKHGMAGRIVDILWSKKSEQHVYTVRYENGMYRRYFEYGLDELKHPVNPDWADWDISTTINVYFG